MSILSTRRHDNLLQFNGSDVGNAADYSVICSAFLDYKIRTRFANDQWSETKTLTLAFNVAWKGYVFLNDGSPRGSTSQIILQLGREQIFADWSHPSLVWIQSTLLDYIYHMQVTNEASKVNKLALSIAWKDSVLLTNFPVNGHTNHIKIKLAYDPIIADQIHNSSITESCSSCPSNSVKPPTPLAAPSPKPVLSALDLILCHRTSDDYPARRIYEETTGRAANHFRRSFFMIRRSSALALKNRHALDFLRGPAFRETSTEQNLRLGSKARRGPHGLTIDTSIVLAVGARSPTTSSVSSSASLSSSPPTSASSAYYSRCSPSLRRKEFLATPLTSPADSGFLVERVASTASKCEPSSSSGGRVCAVNDTKFIPRTRRGRGKGPVARRNHTASPATKRAASTSSMPNMSPHVDNSSASCSNRALLQAVESALGVRLGVQERKPATVITSPVMPSRTGNALSKLGINPDAPLFTPRH